MNFKRRFPVVRQGKDFQVIFKPAFILSEEISPLICHRLDFETSGLLLLAKNRKAQQFFREQFKKREVKKKYQALVLGQFPKKIILRGYLKRGKEKPFRFEPLIAGGLKKFVSNFKQLDQRSLKIRGKTARFSQTKFKLIKIKRKRIFKERKYQNYNFLSLIEAQPFTGRRHQIRVHLKYLGFPILGDKNYYSKLSSQASKILKIPHLELYSVYLAFKTPDNQKIKVAAKGLILNKFSFTF